jgi:hypothetical protein
MDRADCGGGMGVPPVNFDAIAVGDDFNSATISLSSDEEMDVCCGGDYLWGNSPCGCPCARQCADGE